MAFSIPGNLIDSQTTVFWFRRDLRLEDNRGLFHALKEKGNVIGLFIFDPAILDDLKDRSDARVTFIYESLKILKEKLEAAGSSLLVVRAQPEKLFSTLTPAAVYCNAEYEPYALQRDTNVRNLMASKGIPFSAFKDHVIFERDEVTKDDGKPYTIFTPYSRKWKSRLSATDLEAVQSEKLLKHLKKVEAVEMPALKEIGFIPTKLELQPRVISTAVIERYSETRDYPALRGTTRLGIHLRFGTISIRKLAALAGKTNQVWLNELIWREFYQMILFQFPYVVKGAFKPAYDRIQWRNQSEDFEAWTNGMTGYPMVDAGMRELNATGFMHNRARMVVASFLTKHLLIDWRWGEAYFAEKLLDFELASNNGGWQWAAGCGCDAAPYFRVFNPALQAEKFDHEQTYIRKWIAEFGTASYPKPIVDHVFARDRVLRIYKAALELA
jgi:deoxyribodipyrimidine photo-lyase